jgi:hypothetical protein
MESCTMRIVSCQAQIYELVEKVENVHAETTGKAESKELRKSNR